MTNSILCVGGPLDGKTLHRNTLPPRKCVVPDYSDKVEYVTLGGDTVTAFGEHTYRLVTQSKGSERTYKLVWYSYMAPLPPKGMEIRT